MKKVNLFNFLEKEHMSFSNYPLQTTVNKRFIMEGRRKVQYVQKTLFEVQKKKEEANEGPLKEAETEEKSTKIKCVEKPKQTTVINVKVN
jgi:hypothetical protein